MSGSFWKFSNGFTSLSNVLTLLERYNSSKNDIDSESEEQLLKLRGGKDDENSTEAVLSRLLDESDLLQELLSNNSMLLEFLREESVLELLVGFVVNEASEHEAAKEAAGTGKEIGDVEEGRDSEEVAEKEAGESGAQADEAAAAAATASGDATASIVDENEKDEILSEKDDDINEKEDYNKDDSDNEIENEKDEKLTDVEPDSDEEEDNYKLETDLDTSANDDEEDEDTESEDERKTRHATLAAEILAADVWSLTDTVMESTTSLNTLWSILDTTTPLSINLSTYFMKIMEHLLDMKCDEMITYLIDNQPNLVAKFMNHLSNPPLMDFLLKLISTDKPDNSTGIIDFLQNQGLIDHLIQALEIVEGAADYSEGDALLKQSSAADFLKALITISANSTSDTSSIGPNELTRELVSYKQMLNLCDIMLKGDYALANGVGIIIEIIRKNNSDYDLLPVLYITLESHPPTGRDPIYLGHLLKVFGDKIEEFNNLLLKSHENNEGGFMKNGKLRTPFGEIEPLGFERFKICELIAELLHCSNMALLNDNKGFDIVKERDELRKKMKEYDPISFKYNEVIVLPSGFDKKDETETSGGEQASSTENVDDEVAFDMNRLRVNELEHERDLENFGNDTVDSFNEDAEDGEVGALDEEDSFQNDMQGRDGEEHEEDGEEEETHANANLTEAQIRAKPVIGDFLKISLYDTQIISNILTMFFKFPWNNFLHNVVFDIVQQVLNGSMDIGFNKFLSMDLFDRGDITNKIIDGQKECTEYELSNNGLRLGYMGHLTLIAEEVVKFIQLYPANTLSELIDVKVEDKVWEEYVSHVLYDTREKYNAILGGGEDDDDDDEDEDEEASNTFDEGVGEILEDEEKSMTSSNGLLLDPTIDHDMLSAAYDEDYNEHEEDVVNRGGKHQPQVSSDESESEEDDDHFSNYMSLQLSNTNITETKLPSPTTKMSDDEDDEEESSEEEESEYIRGNVSPTNDVIVGGEDDVDDDDDEYIDPNDDGLSYKKSAHPLYDSKGALISMAGDDVDEEELSEDSSSPSSDEDDDDDDDDDDEEIDAVKKVNSGKGTGNKLTRAASKS